MQLFIGGACAGKRDLVAARWPTARWYRLAAGEALSDWDARFDAPRPLVVSGWLAWLEAALASESDDDRLRARLDAALAALVVAEGRAGAPVVVIVPEVGRGIVPMAAADRRWRDLAGWLAQDAAARADSVWQVRHGLSKQLK